MVNFMFNHISYKVKWQETELKLMIYKRRESVTFTHATTGNSKTEFKIIKQQVKPQMIKDSYV